MVIELTPPLERLLFSEFAEGRHFPLIQCRIESTLGEMA